MPSTETQIKDLTIAEFKALIRETVLEVLSTHLDDPDEGLELRPEVQQQLLASRQRRAAGERGISAETVAQKFGMTWQ
jgi:hypothetical protein